MKQQCTYWQKWSKCLRTFVPTSRKSATVRFADYRQIPAFSQLPEIYVVSLPNCLQLHARLSCSMTAIAVLMSNSKNASSIIGDWHSVKAQIPSSGLLPKSMALSCASLSSSRLTGCLSVMHPTQNGQWTHLEFLIHSWNRLTPAFVLRMLSTVCCFQGCAAALRRTRIVNGWQWIWQLARSWQLLAWRQWETEESSGRCIWGPNCWGNMPAQNWGRSGIATTEPSNEQSASAGKPSWKGQQTS